MLQLPRAYHRLGETGARLADVRIITATCRDLPAMVKAGAFRNDLYYRLRGATIELPPLRARADRIELAQVLLEELASGARPPTLSASARTWIETHDWPGNVRELKMALAHAMVLAEGTIEAEHLPGPAGELEGREEKASGTSRRAAEGIALRAALERADGNLSEAARLLGVARDHPVPDEAAAWSLEVRLKVLRELAG